MQRPIPDRSGSALSEADRPSGVACSSPSADEQSSYRFLANSIPQQVWTARADGALDYVNDRVLEYFGRTFDEMLGQGWQEVVHPEDLPLVASQWMHSLATGDPYEVQFRLRDASREYRWHMGRAVSQRDADGHVLRWFGTNSDVHARRMAEDALAESERQFRALVESMPQQAFITDAQGRVHWANRRWQEYTGLDLERSKGDAWQVACEHGSRQQLARHWNGLSGMHGGEARTPSVARDGLQDEGFRVECQFRRSDGTYRWFLSIGVPLRDREEKITRWFVTHTDIDDQKRSMFAERFLAEASVLFSASIEQERILSTLTRLSVPTIADWCVVDMLQPDGSIRQLAVAHVDPAKLELAQELYRNHPHDPSARHGVPEVIRTGIAETHYEIADDVLVRAAQDEAVLATLRALGLRSSICVPLTAHGRVLGALTLLSAESGRTYGPLELRLAEELARRAALAVDNARLYEEVRQLNATLEERVEERTAQLKEANQELESFSYTVSHDLRAPIRHISGFIDLLERHASSALDEKSRRYVKTIGEAAKQMGTLIDALLGFSRMGRTELARSAVALDSVVSEAIRQLEPDTQGRSIDWTIGALPVVSADPTLIRLAIINLISNAIKYTRSREPARVEIGVCEQVGDDALDDSVTIFVRDNGVGFNPAYLDKLFGVFQRLHAPSQFEGTGIGLANVRRIVNRHGGSVRAEGNEGTGATFYVTLPLAEEGTT